MNEPTLCVRDRGKLAIRILLLSSTTIMMSYVLLPTQNSFRLK